MAKNPIKIGIAGLGRAGWAMHGRELKGKEDMFQIVAVCDVIEERRQQAVEAYGCAAYADIAEMIADPNVELVDIATRSADHFEHAKMALEAGKIVFLEKPMCMTYEQAAELQKIAASSSGTLYIRHNRRFEPGFQHIREIIESGILGEVYEIKLRRVSYSRRDDWQTIIEHGGGQLLNWGPHIVDHALQFLGTPPVEVWSNLKKVAAVGDAEDHLKIIMTNEDGLLVDIIISGGAALREPEYLIWGSRGGLTCTGSKITLKYLNPETELAPRSAKPGTPKIGSFGTPETLDWIEETIDVAPKAKAGMDRIWYELYSTIRENTLFLPSVLGVAVSICILDQGAKPVGNSADSFGRCLNVE
jgi:scyllo-inositol 2-dehydrogenase (NADP+)